MGGGKDRKASQQRQEGLSRTQEELGRYFMEQSKQDLSQRRQLQAPVIDYYTKLASGDPTQIMTASAAPLANLSRMTQQARANIMEMAPGAARTAALGQLGREAAGQQSTLLNQAYLSAFPALQGLASESGGVGLQTAGAGYSGIGAAANTNQQIMQMQQQQKASQLGLLGSMAGLAGGLAGGFLGKGKTTTSPSFSSAAFNLPASTAPNLVTSFYQQNRPIYIPGSPAGFGGSVTP